MQKLTYKIVAQHDREREDMTDTLNRGNRQINASMNEMTGWADRVMAKILTPVGDDAILWYNPIRGNSGGAHYKHDEKR